MHISKIRVQNYKAFHDSGWIEFKPGINIISGQNHSGKTALLEALSLDFDNLLHRSIKTFPISSSTSTKYSQVEIAVVFCKEELLANIRQNKYSDKSFELILPKPIDNIKTE